MSTLLPGILINFHLVLSPVSFVFRLNPNHVQTVMVTQQHYHAETYLKTTNNPYFTVLFPRILPLSQYNVSCVVFN